MIRYAPVLGRPHLGQLSLLTGGLTQDVADKIVSSAEPATRAIVRDERNRLAEGLIGGLPFAALSGVTFVATRYLVPDDDNVLKFAGYAASFIGLGAGGWFTFSKITEVAPPAPPSAPIPAVVTQAATAIVNAADPKIRTIVQEELNRISLAAQAGLPFVALGALGLVASALLVPDGDELLKVGAYAGSIGLLTLGAYVTLDKEVA